MIKELKFIDELSKQYGHLSMKEYCDLQIKLTKEIAIEQDKKIKNEIKKQTKLRKAKNNLSFDDFQYFNH